MNNTPVLFLIFNRPDTTAKVFEAIRKQQPRYFFIAADGPRANKPGEVERCEQTRDLVTENIDWDCEVKTLFRNENLGCGKAVSSAISWFFEHVKEGIILEDDCLPHPDFFPYCVTMLEHYRNSDEVMFISGDNFQDGIKRGDHSYYFSAYSHVWGWASWRRVWDTYSFSMSDFAEHDFDETLKRYFPNNKEQIYWKTIFLKMKQAMIDTWDFQLVFSIWKQNGVSIIPNINLVSNIGFGSEATHTTGYSKAANIPTSNILPISHPYIVTINKEADEYFYKKNIRKKYIAVRLFLRLKKHLR